MSNIPKKKKENRFGESINCHAPHYCTTCHSVLSYLWQSVSAVSSLSLKKKCVLLLFLLLLLLLALCYYRAETHGDRIYNVKRKQGMILTIDEKKKKTTTTKTQPVPTTKICRKINSKRIVKDDFAKDSINKIKSNNRNITQNKCQTTQRSRIIHKQ